MCLVVVCYARGFRARMRLWTPEPLRLNRIGLIIGPEFYPPRVLRWPKTSFSTRCQLTIDRSFRQPNLNALQEHKNG